MSRKAFEMEYSLIHVIPFELGISFSSYDNKKDYSEVRFCKELQVYLPRISMIQESGDCFCSFSVSDHICCKLFRFGVGVFVVRKLNKTNNPEAMRYFSESEACKIYYKKKLEQFEILTETSCSEELDPIFSVLERIRQVANPKLSTDSNFLYVFTIYHIIDSGISLDADLEYIDILMNPTQMANILHENHWPNIRSRVKQHQRIGYEQAQYNANTTIAASWSAVAVIESKESDVIHNIIEYEALLQAIWFLFDTMVNNIEQEDFSDLELRKKKAKARSLALIIKNTPSANTSTNEKITKEIIYKTSGIEAVRDKCLLCLDNRISIEQSRHNAKQTIYGIITEILLVAFTLVQLYEPIRKMVLGSFTYMDVVITTFLVIVLIVVSLLIIRKEH